MNRLEHLLQILQEECAETIQAASKAQRFGLDDGCPDSGRTNREDIGTEVAQIHAVVEMIEAEGHAIYRKNNRELIEEKKLKVEKWLKYSESKGHFDVEAKRELVGHVFMLDTGGQCDHQAPGAKWTNEVPPVGTRLIAYRF